MSVIVADLVGETSSTEGTSSYELLGASPPLRSIGDVAGSGDQVWYVARDAEQWEVGRGTYTVAGPLRTLERTEVLANSAGNTSAIDWGTGTRDIYLSPPAATLVTRDETGRVVLDQLGIQYGSSNDLSLVVGATDEIGIYDNTKGVWVWYWQPDYGGGAGRLRIPQAVYVNVLSADGIELGGNQLGTAATGALHQPIEGAAQAGSSTTITLATGEPSSNDVFAGMLLELVSGTGSGQSAEIVGYVGATRVATIAGTFSPAPTSGTGYRVTTGPARSGQVPRLRSDGRIDPYALPILAGATDVARGGRGLPPTPAAGQHRAVLRGDGTWGPPSDIYIEVWRTAWADGGGYSQAHGLQRDGVAAAPEHYWLELECTTAEYSYAIGDRVRLQGFAEQGSSRGVTIWANATNVGLRVGAAGIAIARRDTGAIGTITNANWKIRLRAQLDPWSP